jgi:hypothetical protein
MRRRRSTGDPSAAARQGRLLHRLPAADHGADECDDHRAVHAANPARQRADHLPEPVERLHAVAGALLRQARRSTSARTSTCALDFKVNSDLTVYAKGSTDAPHDRRERDDLWPGRHECQHGRQQPTYFGTTFTITRPAYAAPCRRRATTCTTRRASAPVCSLPRARWPTWCPARSSVDANHHVTKFSISDGSATRTRSTIRSKPFDLFPDRRHVQEWTA